MKSKSILDFVSIGQSGLTIRPLEALFLKKKLITNDKFIKNFDFYHPDNVFILGKDKMEYLSDFLEKPFIEIEESITSKYDFSNWIKRFFKKGEKLK